LRVGGYDVPYRVAGSGPPLVCSELPLNPVARLTGLQNALADTHTVFLLDFRQAIGRPDPPAQTDLTALVADLTRQTMDALHLERCTVLGTFMFATVAMRLAIDVPERVDRLIILGGLGTQRLPRTFWLRASTGLYRVPGFPVLNRSRAVRAILEAVDNAWLGPMRMRELFWDPAAAPLQIEDLYEQNKTPERAEAAFTLMWCIRQLRSDRMAARATEVRCPTLVVHGRDDVWVPPAAAKTIAARIPGARLVVIAEARHAPELDQPAATLAAVRSFLSEVGQ
jgi:pimeloyl-ACP methyl ester carboxylesterase